MASTVKLDYGKSGIELDLTGLNATVIRPQFLEGLADEAAAFKQAVRDPIGSRPLRERIHPGETVAVVIPDSTRALPSDRLLPWLFQELERTDSQNVTIIVGTGTHRANTRDELVAMVGEDIVSRYRIVNHDSRNYDNMGLAGHSRFEYDVYYNRDYLEADRRILLGFIEPHFMAGFSGGYKAAFPGVANLDAIMRYHGYENIAHPRSAWGILEDNPTQAHVRAAGQLVPVDFLINVTLNTHQEITGYFCGDPIAAHEKGCAVSKRTAMAAVKDRFPIVVSTNSGYPLDQSLYQAVKGMAAAAEIASDKGLIITAARCDDGFPEHGSFKEQVYRFLSPEAALRAIKEPDFSEIDQWQTQKLAQILLKNRIQLFSEINSEAVQQAHIDPISDLRAAIDQELEAIGADAPIAILPEGPLTIPYIDSNAISPVTLNT